MKKTKLVIKNLPFITKNFAGIYFYEFCINSQNSQKFIPANIYTNKVFGILISKFPKGNLLHWT